MASFNFEGIGIPIAVIKRESEKGKGKKRKDTEVFFDENGEARNNYPDYILKSGEKFQYIPDESRERSILYIVGASGSGKSWYASDFANQYKKQNPNNPIYLMSYVESDSSIERVKGIERIKLDEEFLAADLSSKDFENSLLIMDDCDVITAKAMKLKLRDLLGKILNTGRHDNVSLVYLSHIACGGLETKPILNEAHAIVFFPQTLSGRARNYLLGQYLNFSRHQIEGIDDIQGRAITVVKSYPMVMVTEKMIIPVKKFGKKMR
jgi:ABC-type dipeptide/oligopeptide/nickel transport system ATPase component